MTASVESFRIEDAPRLEDQAQCVAARFRKQFDHEPAWLVAAPGRVNLIGEHTDYNDGFVLPMAIDRFVVMAGGPSIEGDCFRAHSVDLDETRTFQADDPGSRKNGEWINYLRGVVDGCKVAGLWAGPLDLALQSSVPNGGGLSSSAALEVAMATLIEAATGTQLDKKHKAYIAQKAEHDYAGVPCGIMDQFASSLSLEDHLMLLDCRSAELEMVPFTDPEIAILITNSNVRHELTGGEYAERHSQCEQVAEQMGVSALRDATLEQLEDLQPQLDDVLYRRARHVISENGRTQEAAKSFTSGHWSRTGELMVASHLSLRNDFEVSCPELDLLVELALELGAANGVFGSRMTGGGFGGCTVTLARKDAVPDIARAIYGKYLGRSGIAPSIYVSRPARGAHILYAEDST
jgi:galactokinase